MPLSAGFQRKTFDMYTTLACNVGFRAFLNKSFYLCSSNTHIFREHTRTSLLPFDSDPFVIPNYCIIRDCAHHSPNQQQTFGLAYERAEHWNKYHWEALDCFLKADPVFLTFLGLTKWPVDDYNHVCFDEESVVSHYHVVHSMCGSVSSSKPEATEMVDNDC